MSLRIFKTNLKRTNTADKEAREMYDNARQEELEDGLAFGQGMLHEYSTEATRYARRCYVRLKRSLIKLYPRQRKMMIRKINAKKGLRNTLDKILLS
ncbi:MAG: hypothetical protein ACD_33C00005G0003 [uncultured bacterium]|nr:MAG: hypothetical protein ACD_33C00005G0003 [uncultured bacterium]